MDVLEKLTILTDAAKYDAACTSSGGNRRAKAGYIGNTTSSIAGCCHSFSADGRCVTLLKVLMTNRCVYDCKYCVNRRSNEAKRAMFTPEELADLTIQFYRRNYIEGLFLSSGVYRSPDYTTELMIRALRILREEYRFNGYIHAKAIPGTAPELVEQMGFLADRLSVNIELPSEAGLRTLAPDKTKQAILAPMGQIRVRGQQSREELVKYRHAPRFAPAGQSTQLIVGATADTDFHILRLTQGLYDRYQLKRVFYSAYVPVVEHALLPAKNTKPPLLREHRLYQADWLLRFYGFRAEELLDASHPDFNPQVDPKCSWALRHLDFFPVEVNRADYEALLRIPGVGVVSAKRILVSRRARKLRIEDLPKLGVVMKRAQYFLTASGRMADGLRFTPDSLLRNLIAAERPSLPQPELEQMSLFAPV
ncbi:MULTISPECIES: putative DNA modification/repair radical SAM protein [Oscillospiraceae]|uniref:putative DNA modification/repair radical SAM protein n=1 Tax=Oscillospiraceae TaxID=216572 RepID=UPI000E6488F7|nr:MULTISPECIES: putative DNA modification/repair radical SAM protein [Oscillospiraceae]MBS6291863.1 putative DNA modification/repair radical SAM protein [Oscillibacter sp.]MCQ5043902.1 putative DNA modification/repair radical SAM protein [Dysosmobacter welbionis]